MKILCETSIVNRLSQTKVSLRYLKSTLAIVSHPPRSENAEISIMLFTTQNKTGQKYKIKNNVIKVFTRCLDDGKITLSFREPPQDVLVRCEAVQLKCFLRVLRLGLEGKTEANKLGLSNVSVTAAPLKSHPVTRLVIKSRGDFPTKGLPRTLTSLTITGIDRQRFDTQIMFLKNLTTLDLSQNSIKTIPKELGDLNIRDLNLSDNRFGDPAEGNRDWQWMEGSGLRQSLVSLDLSGNQLKSFPFSLMNLKSLVTLKLDRNLISQIPFSIDRLLCLRFLHIASNHLKTLPANLTKKKFDVLDVSRNQFLIRTGYQPESYQLGLRDFKLWKMSAQVVKQHKIPYSVDTVPRTLFMILDRTPQCSICNVFCFSSLIYEKCFTVELNAKQLIKDDDMILADYILCSKCCGKKRYDRM